MIIFNKIFHFVKKFQMTTIISLSFLVMLLYIIVPINKEMHPLWSVPYFSGTINSDSFKDWKIAIDEIDLYKELTWNEKLNYKFKKFPKNQLKDYKGNGYIGYLYVVKIIHFIAPNIPLIKAVKITQVLLGLLIIFTVMFLLSCNYDRILFLLFYGLNPVVLIFTKMPIYYFWQVIPVFIFILFLLKNGKIRLFWCLLIGVVLGFSLLIRITSLGIILSLILFLLYKNRITSIIILSATMIITYTSLSPPEIKSASNFHAPFIGIGAYPNHLDINQLSDVEGVNYYRKVKDSSFSLSYESGFFDSEVKKDYLNTLKIAYLDYVNKYPLEIFRNAVINTIQGYSFGHFPNKGILLNIISFLVGLAIISLLLYFKEYILFISIGLSVGTISLFFPPIQSYMFGSYILISIALIRIVDHIKESYYPS
jgi:hypothetical protein